MKELVSDELWAIVEPLIPPLPPRPKGGRPPKSNRDVLRGILFVLKSGIPWEMLPQELGCGCGMTCWRRLRDWQAAGVWACLHRVLLEELARADLLDWSRASLDSASIPAVKRGLRSGPTRRTAANRARNAMLWSSVEACLWPPSSRAPTSTTAKCSRQR